MTQRATLTLSIALPLTAGAMPLPSWPPSPGYSVTYTQAVEYPRLAISGAGSLVLADFSLLPAFGCQILLVTLDPLDDTGLANTAPVAFVMTGSTHGTIILPAVGGAFAIVAPGTTGGVTGMTINTVAPCVVRVQSVG